MSFRGGEKTEGGAALLQKGAPPSQPFQMQEEDAFVKASSSFSFFSKRDYFICTIAALAPGVVLI